MSEEEGIVLIRQCTEQDHLSTWEGNSAETFKFMYVKLCVHVLCIRESVCVCVS